MASGVASWLDARDASTALVRARGTDLVFSIRRELHHAGRIDDGTLNDVLGDMEEQGLRYVAVAGRTVEASAGEPRVTDVELSGPPLCQGGNCAGPLVEPVWIGHERVRIVSPLWPFEALRAWRRGLRGLPPPDGGPHRLLVLEFEPLQAVAITRKALTSLIVSLAAAALLLGAAIVFWRLSRRADRISVELARDRQLAVLGEMSAVLGHELRNPLASLKGHAQLLVEKLPEDHPGRRKAETVVREALRLEELTAHVLDFARSGVLDRQAEDPEALARAAADAAGDGRVTVSVRGAPTRWSLDRARMQQVLVNLVKNAVQASPEDAQVDLTVGEEAGTLSFEVRDRGEGIVPGDEERIFEPFYTRRAQGTGLGLAVARRIVLGHGGRLVAGNHPAGGAVFQVLIPREA